MFEEGGGRVAAGAPAGAFSRRAGERLCACVEVLKTFIAQLTDAEFGASASVQGNSQTCVPGCGNNVFRWHETRKRTEA